MKIGSILAIIVFVIVAMAHLVRLSDGIIVTVGDWTVPQWVSIVGVLVPGTIAFMLWKER